MKQELFGKLSVIGMRGCEEFTAKIDKYLKDWRGTDESFVVDAHCPRFGTGEGKGYLDSSVRGHDIFIVCDVFNYGVTYKMYGQTVPMIVSSVHQHRLKRLGSDLQYSLGSLKKLGLVRRTDVSVPMRHGNSRHIEKLVKSRELIVDERFQGCDIKHGNRLRGLGMLENIGDYREEGCFGFSRCGG